MFRKRPPHRPLRAFGRIGRRQRAPQELILAIKMMESGDYQGAAEQFETIARVAESRGGPRAPQFYLKAGRARILTGENEKGLANLEQGLSLLAKRSDWKRFQNAGARAVTELDQRGLNDEADRISEFLQSNLPEGFSSPDRNSLEEKPVLPTHCPSCGGVVRPAEVEWLDNITAECSYCGSPLREEK